MRGIERQVLKIIEEVEEIDRESIAFKMGISPEYIAQICSILVKDGYVEERTDGKLKLTLKGKRVASPVKVSLPVIAILKGGR